MKEIMKIGILIVLYISILLFLLWYLVNLALPEPFLSVEQMDRLNGLLAPGVVGVFIGRSLYRIFKNH